MQGSEDTAIDTAAGSGRIAALPPRTQALREVRQARGCLLRHPRARAGRGPAARGRGAPRGEAAHRQPRALRLRGPGGDPARRDAEPPGEPGILRLEGPVLRAQGRHAVLPADRHPGGGRRRRVHRQRRQRTDRDVDAGAARRWRRGAPAEPRLSALDGRRPPGRRRPGALSLRRGIGVDARPRRRPAPDDTPHQGPRHHQPQQPHRRRLQPPMRDRPRPLGPKAAT